MSDRQTKNQRRRRHRNKAGELIGDTLAPTLPGTEERLRVFEVRAKRKRPLFDNDEWLDEYEDDHLGKQILSKNNGHITEIKKVETGTTVPGARLPKKFSQRLLLLRRQAGLSQAELAKRCKIASRYLRMLEQSERSLSLEVAKKLAKSLGVSLDQLAGMQLEN